MTKEQARAWKMGWAALTMRQREEALSATYAQRLQALAFLMASASLFDMQRLDAEDAITRTRWAQLQSLARSR